MPLITDYGSISQAIADYTHRSDLFNQAAGTNVTDYFLQSAQEMINKDIFDQNFGNGIQYMEAAYGPAPINGGSIYYPAGYLAPKNFTCADGGGNVFTLEFKAAAWIYDRYPMRQPQGLPAFIARDVQSAVAFTGAIANGILTASNVVGTLRVGNILSDASLLPIGVSAVMITGLLSGTGGVGTYSVSNTALAIAAESMTAGGSVFIFGPYPDSAYTVQGVYYKAAALLNSTNTTNWMVTNIPNLFFAAAMMEASLYLRDTEGLQLWSAKYEAGLKQLLDQDKAERWGSATMEVALG